MASLPQAVITFSMFREKNYSAGSPSTPEVRSVRRNNSSKDHYLGKKESAKEGYLRVYERDCRTKQFKFQKRYTTLTYSFGLHFKTEKEKSQKKSDKLYFDVQRMKIIEDVEFSEFGKYSFQVGDQSDIVYFCVNNETERTEWKKELKKAARLSRNAMLEFYHPGVFQCTEPTECSWSCCNNSDKYSYGCHRSNQVDVTYCWYSSTFPLHHDRDFVRRFRREIKCDIPKKSHCSLEKPLAALKIPDPDAHVSSNGSLFKFQRADCHVCYQSEEVPSPGCEDRKDFVSDNNPTPAQQTEKVKNDLHQLHVLKCKSKVSILLFIDVDKLAVGIKGKLLIVNPYTEEQQDITISENIIALKSWRTRIAVETENSVILLDLNEKLYSFSSNLLQFHLVEFTPDGCFVIGCGLNDDNYTIELRKNAPHEKDICRSKFFNLPGKPVKLCVCPNPGVSSIAVFFPDKRSRVLFVSIYDYKTGSKLSQNICFLALELVHSLHTVFFPGNQKLIIGYGKGLVTVDLKNYEVKHENIDFQEVISCMDVSPSGKDLIVGQWNGFASILQWDGSKIVQKSSQEIANATTLTSITYSKDDAMIAMSSENGHVYFLERGPLRHISEDLKLETFTISRSGGHQDLLDSVCIDFPEGFIDDTHITFQYGVFPGENIGPCLFPPDIRPISAVLTLHPENNLVKFNKRIKITMPHWLCLNDKYLEHNGVTLLCALQSDFIRVNGELMLNFKEQVTNVNLFNNICVTKTGEEIKVPVASCLVDHCCHYCFGKVTKRDTDCNLFFLTQIKPKDLKCATDYILYFKLTYALETCSRVLDEQFPKNQYEKSRKRVVFKSSSSSLDIKPITEAKNDGWIVVLKGERIYKQEVYFWDIPRLTLEHMCEAGTYPPGFSVEISTSHYKCQDTEFKLIFPGIRHYAERQEKDLEYKLDLRVNEMCPKAAKSRSPCAQYPTCKSGDQSCEALAVQKLSRRIAQEIGSSITFLMYMFSDMVLSNKQVSELLSKIEDPFEELTEERNILLNYDIVLQVYSEVSQNKQVFVDFCDSLENMRCFRFRKRICDEVEKLCSLKASSSVTHNDPSARKMKSTKQPDLLGTKPAMSNQAYESCKAIAVQKCSRVFAESIESPKDFLSILFSDMILTNEVADLQKCVRDPPTELTREEKAFVNLRIMLLIHDKISNDNQVYDFFLKSLDKLENTSNEYNFKEFLQDEVLRTFESSQSKFLEMARGSQELSTLV